VCALKTCASSRVFAATNPLLAVQYRKELRSRMARWAPYVFAFGHAAVCIFYAALLATVPGWTLPAVVTGAMGALSIALGVWAHFARKLRQLSDAVHASVGDGRLDEGQAILDSLPKWATWRRVDYSEVRLQRATIALLRGDPAKAREEAARAIDVPSALLPSVRKETQESAAHALRAVAAASEDDPPTVHVDAAAVRSSRWSTPEHLAYVAIAEAILLARANRRDELTALLARERDLLCDYTTRHYRALARALQRMVTAPRSLLAYRDPVGGEESAEPELTAWIAGVVPAAEVFATLRSPDDQSAPIPPEDWAIARRRPAITDLNLVRRGIVSSLFVVAATVAVFLGNWDREPWTLPVICALLPAVSIGFAVAGQRTLRRLARARRLILSDSEAGLEMMHALATEQLFSARADAILVEIAIRDARFAGAVMHCDRAISRFPKHSETELPDLVSWRAYALAALGKPEEACADLQELETKYPTYSQCDTRIMLAVRRGDLAAARALARQRTPSRLFGRRAEALADVLIATGGASPTAAGEIALLNIDVREDPRLRAWLRAVWPECEVELNSMALRRRVSADLEVEDEVDPCPAVVARRR
jgi:hypothetical protein